jgi:hypothetical protein
VVRINSDGALSIAKFPSADHIEYYGPLAPIAYEDFVAHFFPKFLLIAAGIALMGHLGSPAAAQEFQIPPADQLALMTPEQKVELERQMTTEAQGWPKVTLNERLLSPDPMEVPHVVRGGTLVGVDSLHPASGDATVFDLGGENFALRIVDGDIAVGPGLHVYLVNTRTPESPEHIRAVGFLDLGPLRAHLGSHNYPLPGGPGAYRSVVIYSQPFDVIFAVASIQ